MIVKTRMYIKLFHLNEFYTSIFEQYLVSILFKKINFNIYKIASHLIIY